MNNSKNKKAYFHNDLLIKTGDVVQIETVIINNMLRPSVYVETGEVLYVKNSGDFKVIGYHQIAKIKRDVINEKESFIACEKNTSGNRKMRIRSEVTVLYHAMGASLIFG